MTVLDMTDEDIEKAKRIAVALGYSSYAYNSTSDLTGLYLLGVRRLCVCKTKEFGFMIVGDLRDFNLHELADEFGGANE